MQRHEITQGPGAVPEFKASLSGTGFKYEGILKVIIDVGKKFFGIRLPQKISQYSLFSAQKKDIFKKQTLEYLTDLSDFANGDGSGNNKILNIGRLEDLFERLGKKNIQSQYYLLVILRDFPIVLPNHFIQMIRRITDSKLIRALAEYILDTSNRCTRVRYQSESIYVQSVIKSFKPESFRDYADLFFQSGEIMDQFEYLLSLSSNDPEILFFETIEAVFSKNIHESNTKKDSSKSFSIDNISSELTNLFLKELTPEERRNLDFDKMPIDILWEPGTLFLSNPLFSQYQNSVEKGFPDGDGIVFENDLLNKDCEVVTLSIGPYFVVGLTLFFSDNEVKIDWSSTSRTQPLRGISSQAFSRFIFNKIKNSSQKISAIAKPWVTAASLNLSRNSFFIIGSSGKEEGFKHDGYLDFQYFPIDEFFGNDSVLDLITEEDKFIKNEEFFICKTHFIQKNSETDERPEYYDDIDIFFTQGYIGQLLKKGTSFYFIFAKNPIKT